VKEEIGERRKWMGERGGDEGRGRKGKRIRENGDTE